jgi:hypothetical protein
MKEREKRQAVASRLVKFCNATDSATLLDSTQKPKHFNQTSLKIGKAQHSKYVFFMNLLKRSG